MCNVFSHHTWLWFNGLDREEICLWRAFITGAEYFPHWIITCTMPAEHYQVTLNTEHFGLSVFALYCTWQPSTETFSEIWRRWTAELRTECDNRLHLQRLISEFGSPGTLWGLRTLPVNWTHSVTAWPWSSVMLSTQWNSAGGLLLP